MKSALLAATTLALAAPAFAQTTPIAPALPTITPPPTPAVALPTKTRAASSPPEAERRGSHHRRIPPSSGELRVRAANRAATLEPTTGGYLGGVQVYPYRDGVIYHVLTAPGQVTDIALQPGETLGAVASGDTVRWVIGDATSGGSDAGDAKRTHVLVKPFTEGLATNLVITTDRRTYHLALTSTAHTAMLALSWTYPADQLLALKAAVEATDAARAARSVASGFDIDRLNFGYTIGGDHPAWRPLRAFDDGRQTFIEFPASIGEGEAPPLFLVDARGMASLVNYRVQGRYYVVDRIFAVAELRLGLKHQEIVRITRTGEGQAGRRRS